MPRPNPTATINPPVRYLSQRDNINPFTGKPDGHNQCMVASFVMLTNWLGDKLKERQLQIYTEPAHLACVGRNLQELESRRYNSANHGAVINAMLTNLKLKQRLVSKQLNWDDVQQISTLKRSPVIVGTMITKSGHIVLYIGNGQWHDPYGKASEITNGYFGQGFDIFGAHIVYSEKFIRERIFRSADRQGNTLAINQRRTCWYVEGV